MKTHTARLASVLVTSLISNIAFPLSAAAAEQPLYTVVDLGRSDRTGAGLEWRQVGQDEDFSGANFIPSLGGDPAGNQVNAYFENFRLPGFTGTSRVAVGLSPLPNNGNAPL
jgi:hypothetical protein